MREVMERFDDVIFIKATNNAVLVTHEDWDEEYWIPRSTLSAVTDEEIDNLTNGELFTLRVAQWKVRELGL